MTLEELGDFILELRDDILRIEFVTEDDIQGMLAQDKEQRDTEAKEAFKHAEL